MFGMCSPRMVGILEGETGDWASEEGCMIDRDVGEFEKEKKERKGERSGKVEKWKRREGDQRVRCACI